MAGRPTPKIHRPIALAALEPELQLLLAVGRPDSAEGRASFAALLSRTNLDRLLELGRAHGLLPLLYWRMNALRFLGRVPALEKALREEFHENARRSRLLSGELARLLDLLARAQIPAIALKGPVVSSLLYGHAGLRVFGDLDILVGPDDMAKASELLEAQGYQNTSHLGEHRERWEHALKMIRSDSGTTVELHWSLTPSYLPCGFDFDSLFKRSCAVRLAGSSVRSLDTVDLLLYLCLHGQRHNWIRLEWVCAVAYLFQSATNLDWTRVMAEARRLRLERILLIGACLASDLFHAPLPAVVARMITPSCKRLAGVIVRRILSNSTEEIADEPRGAFLPLLARECFWDRWRYAAYLWHWLSPPTAEDRKALALPDWLSPLYWIVRPVRILLKRSV